MGQELFGEDTPGGILPQKENEIGGLKKLSVINKGTAVVLV